MTRVFSLVLFLSANYILKSYCSEDRQLCVTPPNVTNIPSFCKKPIDIDTFCQDPSLHSDSTVTFLSGEHPLNTTCEVSDASNLTLAGYTVSNSKVAIIKCFPTNNSGFSFIDVDGLQISNLEFDGCGSDWNISFNNLTGLTPRVLSALLFVSGSNLNLKNVNVSNSTSAGIVIFNVAGSVEMESCIVQNASTNDKDIMGGNIIAYNDDIALDTSVQISYCKFFYCGYRNYRTDCNKTSFGTISYSSGLALFLGNKNLTVNITNSNMSNNTGCNGGNMALLMLAYNIKSPVETVNVESSSFANGRAYIGGGLYVTFEDSFQFNHSETTTVGAKPLKVIRIAKSNFTNNHAKRTAGGAYVQWKQALKDRKTLDMTMEDLTFSKNTANGGGLGLHYQAYVDIGSDPHRSPKFRVNLNVSRCTFQDHMVKTNSQQYLSESSVILAKSVPYLGITDVIIDTNNCTALLAIGSTLVFYGTTRIHNNSALTGAGVRLCSRSLMYFTPHLTLVITNNHAHQIGGGILVNENCLVNVPMCFYQYSTEIIAKWQLLNTTNVTIANNTASKGGDNVFGGSLDYCFILSVSRSNENFKNQLHIPQNGFQNPSSISSNPQQVCFQNSSHEYNCSKENHTLIYPGQTVECSVRVAGQVYGSVPGTVTASAYGKATISQNDHVKTVMLEGGNLSYRVYSAMAEVPHYESRLIFTTDLQSDNSIHKYESGRYKPAVFYIEFKDCPFGFSIQNNTESQYSCHCGKLDAITSCSIDKQTIHKSKGQWIGSFVLNNKSHFAESRCPTDYCNNINRIHALSAGLEEDKQCKYNRTGLVCGSCQQGWSLVLGTSECRQNCSNLWLLLIVPFAVAGLLLVFFIHYLNLTVTMGTVCGLIFYANVIQDFSITLFAEQHIPGLTQILRVFLAWLNLDFGIATCFYSGMGAFGKSILLAVFPTYIWAISAVIVTLSNRCISLARVVGNNGTKVLATLFLLSYSKMLRVTISSLNFRLVTVWINDTHSVSKIRWIADSSIAYFDSRYHLSLIILATFSLIVLLPFSISLLCIKHVFSLSTFCKAMSWIDKLKPFFDTYTGPYNDNARFWTGLLLFARLLLLLTHTGAIRSTYSDNASLVVGTGMCLVLCSMMIFLNGVYKKHYLNVLECSLLLNMGLIFVTHLGKPQPWKSIVAQLLVSMAFLTFMCIVLYHIHLKCSSRLQLKKLAFWRRSHDLDIRTCEGMRGYSNIDSTADSSGDEDLLEASNRMVHFPTLENFDYSTSRSKTLQTGSTRRS